MKTYPPWLTAKAHENWWLEDDSFLNFHRRGVSFAEGIFFQSLNWGNFLGWIHEPFFLRMISHDFKVMEACANNGFKRVLLELGGAPICTREFWAPQNVAFWKWEPLPSCFNGWLGICLSRWFLVGFFGGVELETWKVKLNDYDAWYISTRLTKKSVQILWLGCFVFFFMWERFMYDPTHIFWSLPQLCILVASGIPQETISLKWMELAICNHFLYV